MLDHRWTSFVDGGPKLGHYMLFAEKLGHDRRSANYFTVRVANIILMLVTDVNWFTVSSSRESILTLEWSQPPMMTRQHRSAQKLATCCTTVSTFHHCWADRFWLYAISLMTDIIRINFARSFSAVLQESLASVRDPGLSPVRDSHTTFCSQSSPTDIRRDI